TPMPERSSRELGRHGGEPGAGRPRRGLDRGIHGAAGPPRRRHGRTPGGGARARQGAALYGAAHGGGPGDRRPAGARYPPRLCQHRPDRQHRALRHAALLRQSAHRAGTGGGTGGDRRRGVRRPAAAGGLPRGAAVSTPARQRATAFAPASVGNVAIGFDIMGFSVDALGDRVTVSVRDTPGVEILATRGVADELPREPRNNTAGRAVLALLEALRPGFGFSIEIDKGIPLGSGLGGSAASAVGAVVAANAMLPQPAGPLELLKFALAGEAVASGGRHADNIAASLFGGLVLTVGIDH